jgi:hypothetical protein
MIFDEKKSQKECQKWPLELNVVLKSYSEWLEFYYSHHYINNPYYIEKLANEIRKSGFYCPAHKENITPSRIVMGAPNYREGLIYQGLNSRLRAVLIEFERFFKNRPADSIKIFCPEATTQFAMYMRGSYMRFIGTEYSDDPEIVKSLFPIRCENIMDLSFPDNVFDAVLVNDIFEHVYSIDMCLQEIYRVTTPGGILVATFPFNIGSLDSVIKTKIDDTGQLIHLMDPEYHGNPVDQKGSLVFEIPGWNILSRVKKSKWSNASIVYSTSVKNGILGAGFGGIFTLIATK